MLFILSLLLSLNSWLYLPSATGQPVCDCEKIIKEKKCDNPDCIEICNIQDVLNSAGELMYAKCMEKIQEEGFQKKKQFPPKERSAGAIFSYIQMQGKRIQKLNKENNRILKDSEESCPGCDFISKVSTDIKPDQAEEKCKEYIETETFRLWRKATDKNISLCDNTEEMYGKTKELCFQEYKFENCCPKKYLKAHSYTTKFTLREEGENCRIVDIRMLSMKKKKFMKDTLKSDNKKLWNDCPRGCSFHMKDNSTYTPKGCSENVDLTVLCTHKRDDDYQVSINYEGGIQCNKNE